jgi:hypothetical protein
MTATKRCPVCGQLKAAQAFYRRRGGRQLSAYCRPCSRAASRAARNRRDSAAAERLRAVDRIRQRRRRALGRQGGEES